MSDLAETRRPRVVVLSLAWHPAYPVRSYVDDLVKAGVDVDLVVAEARSAERVEIDPRVRVRNLVEARLPFRRVESIVVYTLSGKILGKTQSLVGDRRVLSAVDRALGATEEAQSFVSRGVYRRMFMPVYRLVRPLILSHKAKAVLADLDFGSVDRIVAADRPAVPLGWRLARRYPNVRATTALDRKPYVGNPDAN